MAKSYEGKVVSDKMDKTVVVVVAFTKRHPIYRKLLRSTRRFKVHDTLGAKVGDRVRIVETRPLSKEKHWQVVEVLEKH